MTWLVLFGLLIGAGLMTAVWIWTQTRNRIPLMQAMQRDLSSVSGPIRQRLCGSVSDEKNQPFRGLRVVVIGRQVEGLTDADGQFCLEAEGALHSGVTLRFSLGGDKLAEYRAKLGLTEQGFVVRRHPH